MHDTFTRNDHPTTFSLFLKTAFKGTLSVIGLRDLRLNLSEFLKNAPEIKDGLNTNYNHITEYRGQFIFYAGRVRFA